MRTLGAIVLLAAIATLLSLQPDNVAAQTRTTAGQIGTRLYIAPDGQEFDGPSSGPTTIQMLPGSTQEVSVWLFDPGSGQTQNNHQIIIRWHATPLTGATGTVSYLDDGSHGSGTVFVDQSRPDWIFAAVSHHPSVYYETKSSNGFGFVSSRQMLAEGDEVPGTHYLGHFTLTVSPDAGGVHELGFAPSGTAP